MGERISRYNIALSERRILLAPYNCVRNGHKDVQNKNYRYFQCVRRIREETAPCRQENRSYYSVIYFMEYLLWFYFYYWILIFIFSSRLCDMIGFMFQVASELMVDSHNSLSVIWRILYHSSDRKVTEAALRYRSYFFERK